MRVETVAEQVFFTTVFLTGRVGSDLRIGTGFVHAVETESGSAHFLITNRHVLDGTEELTLRMCGGTDGVPALGQANQVTVTSFGSEAWTGHPDPRIDVAVMPLWDVLVEMNRINVGPGGAFFRRRRRP